MKKIEFNSGFVTAISLFLEHKMFTDMLPKDKEGKIICDLRLYTATDHLYDMEIPEVFDGKLRNRILDWKSKCFENRMEHFKDTKITDALFKEAEDILAQIDLQMFQTKKVIIKYR